MTANPRNTRDDRSFSNGNSGPDEDQWSGNPLRPAHWWHWA